MSPGLRYLNGNIGKFRWLLLCPSNPLPFLGPKSKVRRVNWGTALLYLKQWHNSMRSGVSGNYLLLWTIRAILTKRLLMTPVRRQAGNRLVDPHKIPLLRTEEPTTILLWTRLPIRTLLLGLTPMWIIHRPLVLTKDPILLLERASEPCTRTWADVLHRKPGTLPCPVLSLLGALNVTQV